MMKKILISLSVASVLSLNAGTIPVSNGWTLAGAPSDISMDSIKNNSSCVRAIWQWEDGEWFLYHKDGTFGFNPIVNDTLKIGSGFWILGDDNCEIEYNENTLVSENGFVKDDLVGKRFYIVRPSQNLRFIVDYASEYGSRTIVDKNVTQEYFIDEQGNVNVKSDSYSFIIKLLSKQSKYYEIELQNEDGNKYYQRSYFDQDEAQMYIDSLNDSHSDDINISLTLVESIKWGEFNNAISIENDDDYYSVWSLDLNSTPVTFEINGYGYEDGSWEIDDSFKGSIIYNSDYNISINESKGFKADVIIKKTEKVDLMDLYISDIEFHVTASGTGYIEKWDNWVPTYWEDSVEHNVTTNEELKNLFLNTNTYIGEEHALLNTNQEVVKGEFEKYYDDCTSRDGDDCKIFRRTEEVIGNWKLDSDEKIIVELPTNIRTVSLIEDDNSTSGYFIQEVVVDKVGSVQYEKLLTGNDATKANVEKFISEK